jgi:hypothetical protein
MPAIPDAIMNDLMTAERDGDPYRTEVHRWWHLSRPSPELVRALGMG